MTLKEAYEKGRDQLEKNGIDEAGLDAWYLMEHVTGLCRASYLLDNGKEMDTTQNLRYLALIQKRACRIPLQYLTGVQEFMGLEFQVNEQVLIPRQDTEVLVETALEILQMMWLSSMEQQSKMTLLDMCTGSGCIVLSILNYFKNPLCGIGVDISGKALAVAERNSKNLGIGAEFIQSNLFENVNGRFSFSMIVSNPPYIRTSEVGTLQEEVSRHEPLLALDGGKDGLYFYRKIVQESRQYLVPGGYLLFEIGYDQAQEVTDLMYDAGFQKITVKKDLAGLDRVVSGLYDNRKV